jgi:hypothetical protein
MIARHQCHKCFGYMKVIKENEEYKLVCKCEEKKC